MEQNYLVVARTMHKVSASSPEEAMKRLRDGELLGVEKWERVEVMSEEDERMSVIIGEAMDRYAEHSLIDYLESEPPGSHTTSQLSEYFSLLGD